VANAGEIIRHDQVAIEAARIYAAAAADQSDDGCVNKPKQHSA